MTRLFNQSIAPKSIGAALAAFAALIAFTGFNAHGQSAADGKTLFDRRCGGCHALDRDKEGPRLGGVYGRTAGSIESFQYSDALKKSKIRWLDGTLDQWLTDTEKLVPNNDMAFRVVSPDERSQIIGYLKQTSGR